MESENQYVEKAGWVFSLKEPGTLTNWKKKWMSIDDYKIVLSPKENKESSKANIIYLYAIQHVRAIVDFKGKQNVFKVATPSIIYNISVSEKEERGKWIAAIQDRLPKLSQNRLQNNRLSGNYGMVAIGNALLSQYQRVKVIGRGGFSTVYLVVKEDSRRYFAMKVIKQGAQKMKNLVQEAKVLNNINHPFLIKMHSYVQTEQAVYFVMDFINGGAIYYHLRNSPEYKFSENRARFYTAQIVCGVEYLHKRGVIYRDLKPENILLSSEGNIVLTDFGLSKSELHGPDARTTTRCGTPQYVAPEIILGNEYTKAVDWWSLGVVLYEMLTGISPFHSNEEMEIYHNIVYSEIVISTALSTKSGSLIRALLEKDPNNRLSDPTKIKKHPFFKGIKWKKLQNLLMTPPFIPQVRGPDDARYVEESILNLPVDPGEDTTMVSSFSDFTIPTIESQEYGSDEEDDVSRDSDEK